MTRSDLVGILAGLFLLMMGWLDPAWRWFWLGAGLAILVWSLWTAAAPRRVE